MSENYCILNTTLVNDSFYIQCVNRKKVSLYLENGEDILNLDSFYNEKEKLFVLKVTDLILKEGVWSFFGKDEDNELKVNLTKSSKSLENCYLHADSRCFIRPVSDENGSAAFKIYGIYHTEIQKKPLVFDDNVFKEDKIHWEAARRFLDVSSVYLSAWNKSGSIIIRQKVDCDDYFVKLLSKLKENYEAIRKERWMIYFERLENEIHVFERIGTNVYERKRDDIYKDHSYRYLEPIEAFMVNDVEHLIIPYFTENMRLTFLISEKRTIYSEIFRARIDNFYVKNKKLIIKGRFIKNSFILKNCILVYRSKKKENIKKYELNLIKKEKKNAIYYKIEIDLENIRFEQFYWDIILLAQKDEDLYEFKLSNTDKKFKLKFYKTFRVCEYQYDDGHIVYPYLTEKGNLALAFRKKEKYDSLSFRLKERMAFILSILLKPYFNIFKIAIVFEKFSVMAQDNSWYFFEYCMQHEKDSLPKKKVYYIMDPKSDDYARVLKYESRVLKFLSLKHMIFLFATELLISTDTKFHSYAWKVQNSIMINRIKKKKIVFLQHGVISLKKVHHVYKKGGNNTVDLFVTSSEVEKDIILNYFGYKDEEVVVTGLPRWDVLKDCSNELQTKEILLMPTWRNWLDDVEDDVFMASDYYKNYMEFLNSEKLSRLLESFDLKLNFYIHPKFREYMSTFVVNSDRIRLIPFGSEQLNILMMRCSILITDYSSVCWDVFYQGKPIIFYQFDLEEYNETQGSYIDMKKDLFGDRVESLDDLLVLMEQYAQNSFKEKLEYQCRKQDLYKYIDTNNSKRICEEIMKRGW